MQIEFEYFDKFWEQKIPENWELFSSDYIFKKLTKSIDFDLKITFQKNGQKSKSRVPTVCYRNE